MTPERLAEIKARVDAVRNEPVDRFPWPDSRDLDLTGEFPSWDSADLAAHARRDVPDLLAEVERLRADVERYRSVAAIACQRVASGEYGLESVMALINVAGM